MVLVMELWNGDEPIVYCLVVSTYPSEKYESQLGLVFPISGKIENVPNHHFPIFGQRASSVTGA